MGDLTRCHVRSNLYCMVRNMWLLQTTLDMDKDRGPGDCSFGTIWAGGLMKLAQMWRRVVSQALQRGKKKVPECNGKQRRQRGAHLFSKDARVTRAPLD